MSVAPGRPAPELCLRDVAGAPRCLRDLRGQPVVVVFLRYLG